MKSYENRVGFKGVLICSRSDGGYHWKNIDGKIISKHSMSIKYTVLEKADELNH